MDVQPRHTDGTFGEKAHSVAEVGLAPSVSEAVQQALDFDRTYAMRHGIVAGQDQGFERALWRQRHMSPFRHAQLLIRHPDYIAAHEELTRELGTSRVPGYRVRERMYGITPSPAPYRTLRQQQEDFDRAEQSWEREAMYGR